MNDDPPGGVRCHRTIWPPTHSTPTTPRGAAHRRPPRRRPRRRPPGPGSAVRSRRVRRRSRQRPHAPASLKSRVLAEARRRRTPTAVVAGASPTEVHRVEAGAGDPVAARPDARRLGAPRRPARAVRVERARCRGPSGGERDAAGCPAGCAGFRIPDRHRQRGPHRAGPCPPRRPPASTCGGRVGGRGRGDGRRVAVRGEARLDEPIDWWGWAPRRASPLMVRAFETWTHADDVRRAIGVGVVDLRRRRC